MTSPGSMLLLTETETVDTPQVYLPFAMRVEGKFVLGDRRGKRCIIGRGIWMCEPPERY